MPFNALAALVLAATLAAPAFAQDRPSNYTVTPTAPGAVKVCAWNMEWFPAGTIEPKPAKEEAERIDAAARFLRWQNADIVMMEEMRDAATCSNLVARPALQGFRINVCSQFSPPYRSAEAMQQTAVISKYDTVDSGFMEWNRRRVPASPPRGLTWCVLDVKGELWAIVCVHLKSNRINPWEDETDTPKVNMAKREEATRQLMAFVKANLEGKSYAGRTIKNIFIGGDLNTDPAQAPYAKETTVPTITEAGYMDVFADVPEDKRWTMPETRRYPATRFDYIFIKGPATFLNPEVAPKQYTSDHCMVAVQVKANSSALFSSQTPPPCPKCGSPTVLHTSPQDGRKFWGCSKFPDCRGFREISR